jgi:hypothetical protein
VPCFLPLGFAFPGSRRLRTSSTGAADQLFPIVDAELGSNVGATTPKHLGRPRVIQGPEDEASTTIHNPLRSAKPPSPVQIRAAPATFPKKFRLTFRRGPRSASAVPELCPPSPLPPSRSALWRTGRGFVAASPSRSEVWLPSLGHRQGAGRRSADPSRLACFDGAGESAGVQLLLSCRVKASCQGAVGSTAKGRRPGDAIRCGAQVNNGGRQLPYMPLAARGLLSQSAARLVARRCSAPRADVSEG